MIWIWIYLATCPIFGAVIDSYFAEGRMTLGEYLATCIAWPFALTLHIAMSVLISLGFHEDD